MDEARRSWKQPGFRETNDMKTKPGREAEKGHCTGTRQYARDPAVEPIFLWLVRSLRIVIETGGAELSTLMLMLVLVLVPATRLRQGEEERGNLQGIDGFYLSVLTPLPQDLATGLSKEQIKSDIETKLRMGKIKVGNDFSSSICVYIDFEEIRSATQPAGYAAYVEIQCKQAVTIKQNGKTAYVPTWQQGQLILNSPDPPALRIRSSIQYLIDDFIKNYLMVNPQK